MFVVLWEFEVKPDCAARFETVYGPAGEWVRLFRSDSNYQGTRLLRDTSRHGIYITIDLWRSREAYDCFRKTADGLYRAIDAECEGLTCNERHIGSFESETESA
jgi:heme-degrading monooxygenase HmoA